MNPTVDKNKGRFKANSKQLIKDVFFYGVIIARWPYDTLLSSFAISKLRKTYEAKAPMDTPKLVDFCFDFDYHGMNFKPFQVKSEIISLVDIVKKEKPKIIMEIGTAKGGTLFLFSKVSPKDAKIYSLDIPGMPYETFFRKWRIRFFRSFAYSPENMHLLWMNSHEPKTFNEIKSALKGQEIDFLFIDGDHSYEGAKKDFEMYSKLVRKGGIIAMHDVAKHPPEKKCDVDKFFNELEKKYKTKKFIEDKYQGWGGIGVVYL